MERRKALAVAGTITVVLGTSVVAAAALGGLGFLGFSPSEASGIGTFTPTPTTAKPLVISRTQDVYDKYVVDDGTDTTIAGGSSALPAASSDPGAPPLALPSGSETGSPSGPPETEPADDPPPTSAQPAPPTTQRHHEEEDDGSSSATTVPPPANCDRPHYDDGHWECGGDD